MKLLWLTLVAAILISVIALPIILTNYANTNTGRNVDQDLLFGVTFGSNKTSEAKLLIDKVKGYTNLFIMDSWVLAMNETATTEICDYAVNAGLNVMVYFEFIFYNVTTNVGNVYNASTWASYGITPWHVPWLNNTTARWGNKFLGAYLMDEPGGNQLDRRYYGGNNVTFAGNPIRTFENVSSYSDVATRFVSGISRNRSVQLLTNTSYPNGLNHTIPMFTSDYALYWFDYKAGYSTVFAELGGTRGADSKVQQIALCRGAATAQNKDWGAIITWATNSTPYLESGQDMLRDMTMVYDAGAKYLIVFNYPQINDYGVLTNEHFEAMQKFWNHIHTSPRNADGTAQVAFVLPKDYGWGMRNPEDIIWGFWPADNLSSTIWDKMTQLIDKHGLKLDIVYDDPQFSYQQKYSAVFYWNSTIE